MLKLKGKHVLWAKHIYCISITSNSCQEKKQYLKAVTFFPWHNLYVGRVESLLRRCSIVRREGRLHHQAHVRPRVSGCAGVAYAQAEVTQIRVI